MMSRGSERRRIVRDNADRQKWIDWLRRTVETHGWRLHCFVLMPKHYLNLDAIRHGYGKDSAPENPDFDSSRITLVGWLKALVFNTLQVFKANLRDPFSRMQAGKPIRDFLLRPESLYATDDDLTVALDPFDSRHVLAQYVEQLHAAERRVPWLGNRRLRFTLANHDSETSGSQLASLLASETPWCYRGEAAANRVRGTRLRGNVLNLNPEPRALNPGS